MKTATQIILERINSPGGDAMKRAYPHLQAAAVSLEGYVTGDGSDTTILKNLIEELIREAFKNDAPRLASLSAGIVNFVRLAHIAKQIGAPAVS